MVEIISYLCALCIGLTLGLIGGGGSILTIPVLVYIMGVEPVLATAYSLFIVGASALVGAIKNSLLKNIDFEIGVFFAIPSLLAIYVTRSTLVPAIPDIIYTHPSFTITKSLAIMVFFAIIMLLASISMIRSKREECDDSSEEDMFKTPYYLIIMLEGFVVGVITGIVGAGGGFLIIPALVLLGRLPMKKAVGTSLMIIATKSLIGFSGDLVIGVNIDWLFLLIFTCFSTLGIGLGIFLSTFIKGANLKKGFGYFVLVMAIFVLTKELL
jgi:uncharacterized membrane protein YfcA